MTYQFTNGQTFDIDEIESYFIDVTDKVNSQNYNSMVSGGLWSESGINIGSSTEMIKFRYYSPDHVLLEQENVPIVMDGNGVKTHTVYTALSNTTTKPDESSFSTSVKSVSSSNKYLWQYEVTEYTNGTIEGGYSDAKIVGVYGDTGSQGVRGCIYLGCFANDSAAYNSLSLIVNEDYYLNSQDGYIYVYTGSSWDPITDYSDHRYMEAVNDALGQGLVSDSTQKIVQAVNAWTQNLIAGTALINKLFAKEMTMQNGGLFKSQNYNGTITNTTDTNGNITDRVLSKNGTAGFAMDSHGNMDVISGAFSDCSINNCQISNMTATEGAISSAHIRMLIMDEKLAEFNGATIQGFFSATSMIPGIATTPFTTTFGVLSPSFVLDGYFMIIVNSVRYQIMIRNIGKENVSTSTSSSMIYYIRGILYANSSVYKEGVITLSLSGARASLKIDSYDWLDSSKNQLLSLEGSLLDSSGDGATLNTARIYYNIRF